MPRNLTNAFTDRVLDLNRATAITTDLAAATLGLSQTYARPIPNDDEERADVDLATAVGYLLDDARAKWLTGPDAGLDRYDADHYREGAINRARGLAATAEGAREAAEALALMLEAAEAFDTADYLGWLIESAASNHRAGDKSYDLAALWVRLSKAHHSPAIGDEAADALRREFDLALGALGILDDTTGLGAEVHIWRDDYLKYRAEWNTEGWAYAIATARTWAELRNYWEALPDAARGGTLTGAENTAAHDAIITRAAHLATTLTDTATDADRLALHEAATHYNTDHGAIMMRIRTAATMAALWHVAGVVDALEGNKLNLQRAIARKFDRLNHTSAADDATGDDPWGEAARMAASVAQWRDTLRSNALHAARNASLNGADPEDTYSLMYAALADARDRLDAAHTTEYLAVVDALTGRGQITADHATRLRALAAHGPAAAEDARGVDVSQ